MHIRIFLALTFIFSSLFGLDLQCPAGCGQRALDPCLTEIGLNFKNCLQEIGFLNHYSPVEHGYEIETFRGKTKRYKPIGYRTWTYSYEESDYDPYDEDEEEEFGAYAFERSSSDKNFSQDFTFENYSDFLNAFSLLNRDLEFYYNSEVEIYEDALKLKKEVLETIQPGCIAFNRTTSEVQYYKKIVNYTQNKFVNNKTVIGSAEEKIDQLFGKIYDFCLENHDWTGSYFQRGLRCFHHEDFEGSLENISKLIEKTDKEDLVKDVHLLKGQSLQEVALYHDAVIELTKAIEKDPSNAESYLERASCYFELGQFDLSLADYLLKQEEFKLSIPRDFRPLEFGTGFSMGALEGISDACEGFIPGLLSSVNGLGNLIWTTIQHPIENSNALLFHINQLCQLLKKIDGDELAKILVPELYEVISNWDQLKDIKKGEQIGYVIGKYGINIFSPIAAAKGIKYAHALSEIKKANKLCTLEALSKPKSKKDLIKGAKTWNESRTKQLSHVKIEMDKQGKHIVGHKNFQLNRSEWVHPNPQELLKKYGGKGQRTKGELGKPGYKERVDFGEFIGYFIAENSIKLPTTRGMIHYSKKGAHIVPADPRKSY